MPVQINVGDYIRSDFASFIQGIVISEGVIGKRIPVYKIIQFTGEVDLIIKGQAELLLTKEELNDGLSNPYARHD